MIDKNKSGKKKKKVPRQPETRTHCGFTIQALSAPQTPSVEKRGALGVPGAQLASSPRCALLPPGAPNPGRRPRRAAPRGDLS